MIRFNESSGQDMCTWSHETKSKPGLCPADLRAQDTFSHLPAMGQSQLQDRTLKPAVIHMQNDRLRVSVADEAPWPKAIHTSL